MLNEFAFMWAKKKDFPLHCFVFRQTASHLSHEGNVEQTDARGSDFDEAENAFAELGIEAQTQVDLMELVEDKPQEWERMVKQAYRESVKRYHLYSCANST